MAQSAEYNKNRLKMMTAAAANEELTTKPLRREVGSRTMTDLLPVPSIVINATASSTNVVLVYSLQHKSIVAMADVDGDGEVDSFTLYVKHIDSPVSAIVPIGDLVGTTFVSTYGNTLLKLLTTGVSFNPPRQEFIGVANADAVTYNSGSEPILSFGYLSEMMQYQIDGDRISIGPRTQQPMLPSKQGAISLTRDSKGNAYAITQEEEGNTVWKIPVSGQHLAWNKAFPIRTIPGAVHLSVDRTNDDLYVAASSWYVPNVPGLPGGGGSGGDSTEIPSRIYVLKNVSSNQVADPLIFASDERLRIENGPTGGITANAGMVFVGSTFYNGYQGHFEILQYSAGPRGTVISTKVFLPADLAGTGFYSGLTLFR